MGISKDLFLELQQEISHEIDCFEEGNQSSLDAFINLREQRKMHEECIALIKQFEDEYKNTIESDAEGYPSGYNGYKIECRSGGVTYDYSDLKEWQQAEQTKKDIEAKYKQAYLSKQKGLMPLSDDGEVLDLPTPKYRKGSIILKKV